MTQIDTPTVLTDAVDDAAQPVPVDQRPDTIQFYAAGILALWAIAPAPALDEGGQVVTDADDNPTWADMPDLDTLSDGQIEKTYSGCVRRACASHIKPGLLRGKAKSKSHGFLLDLYEDLAKSQLKAIRTVLKDGGTSSADYEMVRQALDAAGDAFTQTIEEMVEIGKAIGVTVAHGNHKSVTLKGGNNAVDFFTRVFPGVRGSKTEARDTAASML